MYCNLNWVSKNKPFSPLGFISLLEKNPINNDPVIPVNPCTELTSKASSISNLPLKNFIPNQETKPKITPIIELDHKGT